MPLGSLLWNWLNFGLFFATLWKLVERGLPGDWTARHKALFLCLVLLGTTRTIWSGQTNLLIFSLIVLATLAIQDRRWWWAAFLLAIAIHIKVWPLAAALLLIAYWPRKLALRLPAAVLAVGVFPLLVRPWGWVWRQYVGWYDLLVGPAQVRHMYRDVWTLWEVVHEPVDAKVYLLLQLLSGGLVLGLCLWQVRRGLSIQRRLLFVMVAWAVWQMTFGPATERVTFGLIAPLSSWGLATAFQQRRGRLLMLVAFVLMTGSTFGVIERALMDYVPAVVAAHPVGSMLFFAWFLNWNHQTADAPLANDRRGLRGLQQIGIRTPGISGDRDVVVGQQARRLFIGNDHPGLAVRAIFAQPAVLGGRDLAGPNHGRAVDIGPVVDPLLVTIVVGRVAHEYQVTLAVALQPPHDLLPGVGAIAHVPCSAQGYDVPQHAERDDGGRQPAARRAPLPSPAAQPLHPGGDLHEHQRGDRGRVVRRQACAWVSARNTSPQVAAASHSQRSRQFRHKATRGSVKAMPMKNSKKTRTRVASVGFTPKNACLPQEPRPFPSEKKIGHFRVAIRRCGARATAKGKSGRTHRRLRGPGTA